MNLPLQKAASILNTAKANPDKAIRILNPMLRKKSPSWEVYHLTGKALCRKKNWVQGARFLQEAMNHGSDLAETDILMAQASLEQGLLEDAESYAKKAVTKQKDNPEGWIMLGAANRGQGQLDRALQCYARANQLDPRNAEIALRIGMIYRDQGNLKKALELYNIALKVKKDYTEALVEKVQVLQKLFQFDRALGCLEEALEKKPRNATLKVPLAELHKNMGNYEKSLRVYEEVLLDYPKNGAIRSNYALCLQDLARFTEAEKNYLQAFKDKPDAIEAFSNYLMTLHYNPERTQEEIFREHFLWDQYFAPKIRPDRPVPDDTSPDRKLRIGFISGGFNRHPVGWMITLGLENLSKDQFEIYCYTTNNIIDPVTKRIHAASSKWQSVMGYNDEVIARMIREDEIDIMVELSGHSAHNRLRTIALEPSPVIVKWVGGLFNTSGLKSMDYLISDWHETPEGEERWYTEKLVRLPDDYICFLPPDYAPPVGPLPVRKNGYITFGCFNNPTKVNEVLLDKWADLMNRISDSRLLLKSKQYGSEVFTGRIVSHMEKRGIAKERIIFEGQSPHDHLLNTYNRVDVALDPWPYSGGLTTCEALWMGVPVVTLPGPTFAGRHSATHLVNAGFPELVVNHWEEYIGKAVELASDPDTLAEMRAGLREQVRTSPLCDGKRFGAHLGQAFREMWKQWVRGQENMRDADSGLLHEALNTAGKFTGENGLPEGASGLKGGSSVEGDAVDTNDWRDHIAIDALPMEEKPVAGEVHEPVSAPEVNGAGDTDQSPSVAKTEESAAEQPVVDGNKQEYRTAGPPVAKALEMNDVEKPVDDAENVKSDRSSEDPIRKIETRDELTLCVPSNPDIPTTYILMEQGQWFEEELSFVRDFLKPGMNAVDAGAGFGVYSLLMAKMAGPSGKVFAFEPVEETRSCLIKSKKENAAGQLEILPRALGAESANARLLVPAVPEVSRLDNQGDREVAVVTLNQWWSGQDETAIDLIKIDVNGTELNVLKGAHTLLQGASPIVIAALNKDTTVASLSEEMEPLGYQLFTYVPGPGLLAQYDEEEGHDSSLQNLVLVPESRIDELKQAGLIYDETREMVEVPEGIWLETLRVLPWSETLVDKWEAQASEEENREYLKALDHLCTAEKLMERGDGGAGDRTDCAMLLVGAADILIGRYNDGDHSLELTLTLSRLLSMLGKRAQALEMIAREVAAIRQTGKKHDMKLPFLMPLKSQDNLAVHSDFQKWLTVRLVEAWLLLSDHSSVFSNEQRLKLLQAMDGNPECGPEIKQRIRMRKLLGGEAVEEEQSDEKSKFGDYATSEEAETVETVEKNSVRGAE